MACSLVNGLAVVGGTVVVKDSVVSGVVVGVVVAAL